MKRDTHRPAVRMVDRATDSLRLPGVHCATCGRTEWSVNMASATITAEQHRTHGERHPLMRDAALPGTQAGVA